MTSKEPGITTCNMRRSKLNLKIIFKITKAIIKEKPLVRGRPRTYSEIQIISIFLKQTLRGTILQRSLKRKC